MRKYYIFFNFCTILFFGCSEGNEITPTNNSESIFRIEYEQSGNTSVFIKSLGIGENFVFADTKESAPITLLNDDLMNDRYAFENDIPVQDIEITVTAGHMFVLDTSDYSEMKVKMWIFRNSILIDSLEYITTSTQITSSNTAKYTGE